VHCALIYKIEFWYKILEFKKKMPRRLLKVGTKRLILTCFETFIEANGKTTHKDEHHHSHLYLQAVKLEIWQSRVWVCSFISPRLLDSVFVSLNQKQ
jgi:hypothetical protein